METNNKGTIESNNDGDVPQIKAENIYNIFQLIALNSRINNLVRIITDNGTDYNVLGINIDKECYKYLLNIVLLENAKILNEKIGLSKKDEKYGISLSLSCKKEDHHVKYKALILTANIDAFKENLILLKDANLSYLNDEFEEELDEHLSDEGLETWKKAKTMKIKLRKY